MSIKFLLFFSFCVFMVSSCSSGERMKIGLLLPNKIDDRFPKDQLFFTRKITELGGKVLCEDAQNNDQLQISQANELIEKGIKVLVVCAVNRYTAPIIVRNAHAKGIKVIAYERIISNCDLDYYVSFDNVKVGEIMASYSLKLKPSGNYLLFGGDKSDQNAVWVNKGIHNVIDPLLRSGEIKLIYDIYIEDWSGENAFFELDRFLKLTNEKPDVILSAYDGISNGIIKALMKSNVSVWPIITGQNAEIQACKNIIQRKQAMTVYKPFKSEAEQTAVLAIKCARNEKINLSETLYNELKQVPSILIDPITVDADNMEKTLVEDGFIKESDIN